MFYKHHSSLILSLYEKFNYLVIFDHFSAFDYNMYFIVLTTMRLIVYFAQLYRFFLVFEFLAHLSRRLMVSL